jgi:hypothetical protein
MITAQVVILPIFFVIIFTIALRCLVAELPRGLFADYTKITDIGILKENLRGVVATIQSACVEYGGIIM